MALTNNFQQADTGTKMIHLGAQHPEPHRFEAVFRPGAARKQLPRLVQVESGQEENARSFFAVRFAADRATAVYAHTFPVIDVRNSGCRGGARGHNVQDEAPTTSFFYWPGGGWIREEAVGLIVNYYAVEVLNKLPMEFAVGGAEAAFGEPGAAKSGIEICGAVQRKVTRQVVREARRYPLHLTETSEP